MRFDDTLETVLAADLGTPYGVQSVWRQLVDLIGRRRVPPATRAMATLRAIRADVPPPVRAASARAVEFADPPAPLVRLFAQDDISIAIPVLRSARLTSSEWIQLLPDLSPSARSVLRNRRDLGPDVRRALESFGSVDLVLPDGATKRSPLAEVVDRSAGSIAEPASGAQNRRMDQSDRITAAASAATPARPVAPPVDGDGSGPFEIAEVVARIDAFWRHREETGPVAPPAPPRSDEFRFETDEKGVIRWVDGVSRAALIGLSLDLANEADGSQVDGIAAGAFRRRAGFSTARMLIEGGSDAAGDWLISAVPVFDPANGRFTGYRGTARRPRTDERAEPVRAPTGSPAESLRQLVHELRTPTNAIAGFAEMIETQMLGPVSEVYRERAHVIRSEARELLGAIDDLDLAARIDSDALALTPDRVALRPLLAVIADDLAPLLELRGSMIALPVEDLVVTGDRRAVERLLSRLMATLVSASAPGERIGVKMALESDQRIAVSIDRPRTLADYPGDSVLGIDDEREDATLLGTGFALRLSRNLARELGGSLVIGPANLTLRLPAAVNSQVGQAI
ncbi:HAMP domain-containing sensor histidine kinase [Sphingomonas sp. DG1-23]|uniref:sensor histidine kinase n=1 Tax=Sphingomonas sp. DG1-23 TaxID=3068316 RepID=UPI00273F0183|nr:HAMP domain-containing sensor histidine kinase [Sphingomonas sp. DG1-23]MDP5278749.1 HAMP domain-containing sensor histidine kinase [Sphingomonas sp. DG1-23]